MNAENPNLISDVFIHLENLKTDFARLKTDFNKNYFIVYAMDRFATSLVLIEQLIQSYDNRNFKSLTNEVNNILTKDTELHGVFVTIKKSKHNTNFDHSKMALIIFEI
jgi:low affinity Fe/Cu permease